MTKATYLIGFSQDQGAGAEVTAGAIVVAEADTTIAAAMDSIEVGVEEAEA